MNVKKVKEIIKFDVEKSIQNKWFVILNVVTFIAIIIATNWSHISNYLNEHNLGIVSSEEITIQVLDNEELAFFDIKNAFKDEKNIKLEKVEENTYSKENVPKENTILVEVSSDNDNIINVKIVSKESIDGGIYDKLYNTLLELRSKIFAEKNGITIEDLEVLNNSLNIKREMLGVDAENSETKQMIKLISTIIMYMCLLFVLGRIANEIANEKVSKSIEYVLTSVSAKEYLLAKVLSSTITIAIQVIYTIIYYMIGNMISSLFSTQQLHISLINIESNMDRSILNYVLAMIAYLLFTVFLTTLIQAALSSKTTSVAEAGNTTMLLVVVIVSLYIVSNGLIDPYTKVTTTMYIVSCIPIVSTFFVPSMMIIGQATTIQILVSFLVLIASIPLLFNYCAKVFKNGVLDYSSKKKVGLFNITGKDVRKSLREQQQLDLKKGQAKKFAFAIGLALILLFILQVIFSLLLDPILYSLLDNKFDKSTIGIINNSIRLIISLLLSSGFIKLYSDIKIEDKKKLSTYKKFEIVVIGITLMALIQILLVWFLNKIGYYKDVLEFAGFVPQKTFWGIICFILGAAIVPAIFEELLFRKWILNYSKIYGNAFAVLISAVLFGLYHLNLGQGIFAFLIGIIFGIIVIKTSTIKYTVLLHFLNNLYASLKMILGENSIGFKFVFNTVIAISIVGIVLILKNIPNLKKIKKEDLKINKDCKYLLCNYTFILSIILLVIMFVATEHIL